MLQQLCDVVPKPDMFFKLSPALANKFALDIHGVWLRKLPFYQPLGGTHSMFPNGPSHGVKDVRISGVQTLSKPAAWSHALARAAWQHSGDTPHRCHTASTL